MAGDNATDNEPDTAPLDDSAIDEAVGDLRGVLDKDASGELALNDEGVGSMGGAEALGSDFGADFPDDGASPAADDPFNIGDEPAMGAPDLGTEDFGGVGMGTADFGAADLGAPDLGAPDFAGAADFGSAPGQDFGAATAPSSGPKLGATGGNARVDLVLGIPIDVQIILGSSRMAVSSLMELAEGATIALDRKIGEPVEIMVNGKLIGRGEITVLESDETRFAVRIIEVVGAPQKKSD